MMVERQCLSITLVMPDRAANLKSLSKAVKKQVADQSRNNGNNQIRDRKDIFNGESQTLPPAICTSKFPHQKIGIEQEDYKTDLYERLQSRRQFSRLFRIRCHQLTIAKSS